MSSAETVDQGPEGIASILSLLASSEASDLHIVAGSRPKFRVHGSIVDVPRTSVWDAARTQHELLQLMGAQQRTTLEKHRELDASVVSSAGDRFRANYFVQRGTLGAAFRHIPTRVPSLGELGLPESIHRFATLQHGLVLVTGPTGSGKTTTLAAIIDEINETRAARILTIEDPIEFIHPHKRSLVAQREIGSDTSSFASGLRHALRQDPDVILVGEMRDLESISVALTAAETGHLVLGTLHTQSATQTVDRVIDVFPADQQAQIRVQLASTLQGVICQSLLPRADGSGRVAATEIMAITPGIANLIRDKKTFQIQSLIQAGRDLGMHTLEQSLADLAARGLLEERRPDHSANALGFDLGPPRTTRPLIDIQGRHHA